MKPQQLLERELTGQINPLLNSTLVKCVQFLLIQTTSQKFKFCRLLQRAGEPDLWVRHFLILIVLRAFIHKNGQGLVFLAATKMVWATADIFLFSAQASSWPGLVKTIAGFFPILQCCPCCLCRFLLQAVSHRSALLLPIMRSRMQRHLHA